MPRTGRPIGTSPDCTLKISRAIAKLIREGNYVEVAAQANGISKGTALKWLKLGSRAIRKQDATGQPPAPEVLTYVTFADLVVKALSESQANYLEIVKKAAENGQWQAAAWLLERRHPKHWGRKDYLRMESYSTEKVIIEERRGFARDIFQDEDATAAALLLAERVARRKIDALKRVGVGRDEDGGDDDAGGIVG